MPFLPGTLRVAPALLGRGDIVENRHFFVTTMGIEPNESRKRLEKRVLFVSPGECIEDQTHRHTQKTDKEREVVSLSWIRVIWVAEGLNHSPQGWHEDGRSSHAEEIDPGRGRA